MSSQMKAFLNELQGNMEVVGEFFDNPEKVIRKFGIVGREKEALLIRDLNDMNDYALSIQNSVASPSGAHSSTCHFVRQDLQSA